MPASPFDCCKSACLVHAVNIPCSSNERQAALGCWQTMTAIAPPWCGDARVLALQARNVEVLARHLATKAISTSSIGQAKAGAAHDSGAQ